MISGRQDEAPNYIRSGIQKIALAALADGVAPGVAVSLWVGGRSLTTVCEGKLGDNMRLVDIDTVYDTASVTKAVSTSLILASLIASGKVELSNPLVKFVPEADLDSRITIAHLAGHAAGFPAHREFFGVLWKEAQQQQLGFEPRSRLYELASAVPLVRPPGIAVEYSDVGYILLGLALERAAGARLDTLFRDHVAKPLQLTRSFFVATGDPSPIPLDEIAPTELCPHRGRVHGQVHDENAHAGGGICGHAGLFSTAEELARIGSAVCAAAFHNQGPLPTSALRELLCSSAVAGTTWRLGWDRPDPTSGVSHAGDRWPRRGLGHLGYTGTSLWMEPENCTVVAIACNRVYCSRDPVGIKRLRREIMDCIADGLGLRDSLTG